MKCWKEGLNLLHWQSATLIKVFFPLLHLKNGLFLLKQFSVFLLLLSWRRSHPEKINRHQKSSNDRISFTRSIIIKLLISTLRTHWRAHAQTSINFIAPRSSVRYQRYAKHMDCQTKLYLYCYSVLSRGRGIRCFNNIYDIVDYCMGVPTQFVVQKYIENPLLI